MQNHASRALNKNRQIRPSHDTRQSSTVKAWPEGEPRVTPDRQANAPSPRRIAAQFVAAWTTLSYWRRIGVERRHLGELSDRDLKDVGWTRADVFKEVRRFPWDAPPVGAESTVPVVCLGTREEAGSEPVSWLWASHAGKGCDEQDEVVRRSLPREALRRVIDSIRACFRD